MTRRRLAGALVAALLACAPGAAVAAAPAPRTPIRHFITLMQENHSFDNYFGTYPGADGIPKGTCVSAGAGGGCIKPFAIRNRPVLDLGHNATVFSGQFEGGRLGGFVSALRKDGLERSAAALTMGHYDARDIPFYWNVADDYVLFDRFFTSARGGSVANHMYWAAGAPGTPDIRHDQIPPNGYRGLQTIFDRLEAAGISWKFYVQNYDPTITFHHRGHGDRASQTVWVPLLNFPRFVDNPRLFRHIVDLSEYYRDLEQGTLPAVSYSGRGGASEHPPGSIQAGERFVRTLVNSLMTSSAWSSSAFMWSYDDWGGFYDHVRPPQVDGFGYGFRAPALMVSPYAKRGHIDHTTLDFTSEVKFIERNWGLAPLASRDGAARSLDSAFDFSSPPRAPRILAAARGGRPQAKPRTLPIYLLYGGAVLLTLILIAFGLVRSRPALGVAANEGGPRA